MGAIGVCGSTAANALAADADLVLAVGTRLADFPTGSRALFQGPNLTLVALNVAPHDAGKHGALPLVADARRGLEELSAALGAWRAPAAADGDGAPTHGRVDPAGRRRHRGGPDVPATEAQVIGAVNRAAGPRDVVVCAAGGLPGELSRLWRTRDPRGYHLEYGYSCMGYEIAGGLGVKLALPDREVFVMVGDGSYLMMNSEIATSVAMHRKLVIVLLDNRGFGCINRLQQASRRRVLQQSPRARGAGDRLRRARAEPGRPRRAGQDGRRPRGRARARASGRPDVRRGHRDRPGRPFTGGGAWWDVPVPEVSPRPEVRAAREAYDAARRRQRTGG